MNNTIIVANGAFPRRNEALQAMLSTPLLICCDGAYNKLVDSQLFSRAEQLPRVCVVGDGDSLSHIQPPFPTTFVKDYVDQDTNDLTKAVSEICSKADADVLFGDTAMDANTAQTYLEYIDQIYGGKIDGEGFVSGLTDDIG